MELLPVSEYPGTNMNASLWVRERFLFRQDLFLPVLSEKPFDGLDKMLLLAWVRQHSGSANQSFVLHYWDLRMPNIMLDDKNNVVALSYLFSSTLMAKVSLIGTAWRLFQ